MISLRRRLSLLACLFAMVPSQLFAASAAGKKDELLVFAAASLTDVMEELGKVYAQETGQSVRFSFAASSALARQIESGGRVDVFVSADQEWMDYLQSRKLIDTATRRNVAGNRLVLIAPSTSGVAVKLRPNVQLAAALKGERLATGDPDIVPVGRYARAALIALDAWEDIGARLVRADNVRSALAFVARGETPLGIVYETDARIDARVRIVDVFPSETHEPITYPAAATSNARQGAREFVEFLLSDAGQTAFKQFGFSLPTR